MTRAGLAAVLLAGSAPAARAQVVAAVPEGYAVRVEQTEAGPVSSVSWGADFRHVFFSAERGGARVFVVDGDMVRAEHRGEGFSPDGVPFYIEVSPDGAGETLRLGERSFGPYPRIESTRFARAGGAFAFLAQRETGRVVVLDGREFGPFEAASLPEFTPDGTRSAFWGLRDRTMRLFVDGAQAAAFETKASADAAFLEFGEPVLAPRGGGVAFTRAVGDRYTVVRDLKAGPEYAIAFRPLYSNDGKSLAYSANTGRGDEVNVLVVDGKARSSLPAGPAGAAPQVIERIMAFRFAPDGRPVFTASVGAGREVLVVGDRASRAYDRVDLPVFREGAPDYAFAARDAGRFRVVTADAEGAAYDRVDDIAFHPESGVLAYRAASGDKEFVVSGGKELEAFDEVGWLRFARKLREPAYSARRGADWFVVFRGWAIPAGDGAKMLRDFVLLERHNVFPAWSYRAKDGWRLVAANKRWGPYDEVFAFRYDPESDRLTFAARRGRDFLREEHALFDE